MYEAFYNFRKKPFDLSPDPNFMFKSEKHQKALSYMEYGLSENVGFLVLTGDVGCGKTTTAKYIIRELGRSFLTSYISNTHLSSDQVLRMILTGFSLPAQKVEKARALDVLTRLLLTMRQRGKRVLVVIDEAQNLTAKALEEIRMLSNIHNDSGVLVQILLIGQPELLKTLKKPAMRQLAQRVAVHFHLTGLDRQETADYIAYRLGVVGGKRDLFTAASVDKVFELSRGVPRLINLICEAALVYGFADESASISQDIIRQIITDKIGVGIATDPVATSDPLDEEKSSSYLNDYQEKFETLEKDVENLRAVVLEQFRSLENTVVKADATLMDYLRKIIQKERQDHERLAQKQAALEQKINQLTQEITGRN
ncbi:MAG: AAA family ATPase [Desulfatitalea sp.]